MIKLIRNILFVHRNWQFNINNSEYLRGFFFYYFNKKKFKEIHYPIIIYKRTYIRNKRNIKFGQNITIAYNCFISPLELEVGNNTWLGVNNFICGKVTIGNDVHLGPNVSIPGANHIIDNELPISKSGSKIKGTIIEDYVWIGSNVTILDGIKISKGAVIAANSVVTKDIPEYAIAAGIPANILRFRTAIKE